MIFYSFYQWAIVIKKETLLLESIVNKRKTKVVDLTDSLHKIYGRKMHLPNVSYPFLLKYYLHW